MAFPIVHHLFTLLLLSVLIPILALAQTHKNISLGSSLIASDDSLSWKSPSGEFAFGFHRLENQNLFLLAIWFDKIPDKTLVWYANGDNPAPKGSKIELTHDGNFTLTDPEGQEIWKAEGQEIWKAESVINGVAYAAMLNTGNFILADKSSSALWESFNIPSDTILPTQVMEIGGKLSSPLREGNYSKGRFQLRLLQDGNLVLNPIGLPTEYAYDAYYWSNTVDNFNESNRGEQLIFNKSGYLYVVRRNGKVANLTGNIVPQQNNYYRATLNFDGVFALYAHRKTPINGNWNQSWISIWTAPDQEDICSAIKGDVGSGACGFNSYCTVDDDRRPICECLPGFSLTDPTNKFSDCKQEKIQKCESVGGSKPEDVYEIHVLPNRRWPTSAQYEILQPLNEDDCRKACLDDCTCVVAVLISGRCHKKKLPLSNGILDRNAYGMAMIKVSKFDVPSGEHFPQGSVVEKKDQGTLILVGSLLFGSSVFLNFLLVAGISLAVFCSKQKLRPGLTRVSSILQANIRSFTYEELKEATDGFREEIGRGAFGTVYKGILSSSSTSSSRYLVAVKKLDKVVQEGEKEFKTEASAIAKTHHKNLVRFIGFCDQGPHKLLVYEFMSNGTLAGFLFGISRPDWNKRIEMASGIARGLMYLHEECSTQIIHCDIKPQNILLDDSFTARISDFGLAKLMMNDQTRTHTIIRGTKGYVAPEWFRNMPITAKVDVYSYGVLLLEIICCRKSVEVERENEEEVILTDWAYDCYRSQTLDKLVENDEEARNGMRRLERLIKVAIWCIQEDPSLRPTMKKVTQMLEGVLEVSVPPCPSPFSSLC